VSLLSIIVLLKALGDVMVPSIRIKNRIGKIVLLIINICFTSALEFLFIFLDVLKNKKFTNSDSLTEWTFTILLAFFLSTI
jgi:hypothetical protein